VLPPKHTLSVEAKLQITTGLANLRHELITQKKISPDNFRIIASTMPKKFLNSVKNFSLDNKNVLTAPEENIKRKLCFAKHGKI
jgi:hypothetical protein